MRSAGLAAPEWSCAPTTVVMLRGSVGRNQFETKEGLSFRPCGPQTTPHRFRHGAGLMDVFAFRDFLVRDYERFTRSFVRISG